MPELVEPRSDQRVSAFDLVVEEPERKGAVHGLDPKREAAELHRQGVQVHGVDAAFHDVTAQHCLEARLEAIVLRRAGDQLIAETRYARSSRVFHTPDAQKPGPARARHRVRCARDAGETRKAHP